MGVVENGFQFVSSPHATAVHFPVSVRIPVPTPSVVLAQRLSQPCLCSWVGYQAGPVYA